MMQHPTTSLLNILNETPINDIDEFVAEYGVEFNTGEFFSNYMYKHNIKSSMTEYLQN